MVFTGYTRYDDRHFRGNRMENYFVAEVLTEVGAEEIEYGPQVLRPENVKIPGTMIKTHGTEQTEKPETMIPVDVGDEDCLDLHERKMFLTYALLGAFSAIKEKQAPVHGQCLGAWISIGKGKGRSRTQYRQGEVHGNYSPFSSFSFRAARASMAPRVVFSTDLLMLFTALLVLLASVAAAFSLTS